MRSFTKVATVGLLAVPFLLGACFNSGSSAPGSRTVPAAKATAARGSSGKPCWAGTWLVRSKAETASEADGSAIRVVGDAGEVITLQTNGILFANYNKAGALVGTAGSGPIAVQYQGTENAQLTMTGSTSGTFTERIVDGALFTTVSDGQSNTQKDQPGATETDQYTCSASSLVLKSQGLLETLIRTG